MDLSCRKRCFYLQFHNAIFVLVIQDLYLNPPIDTLGPRVILSPYGGKLLDMLIGFGFSPPLLHPRLRSLSGPSSMP